MDRWTPPLRTTTEPPFMPYPQVTGCEQVVCKVRQLHLCAVLVRLFTFFAGQHAALALATQAATEPDPHDCTEDQLQ